MDLTQVNVTFAVDSLPLAVDLDGTLIVSDTLHESCFSCLKEKPRHLWQLAKVLSSGKAAFKEAVTGHVQLDPALLPYNQPLLDWLRAEKAKGRRIGLFTAADQSIADAIAAHLGIFDDVRGSREGVNLGGANKLKVIRACYGERFAYAGDGAVDAPIFAASEQVVLVGNVGRLQRRLPDGKPVEKAFPRDKVTWRTWARALRVEHWAKNLLILVAPLLGFQLLTLHTALQAAALFLAMGLLASATYIANDLLDLPSDRQHPRKRSRAFAAGRLTAREGVIAGALLLAGATAVALSAQLPLPALASLVTYAVVTLSYSLYLKRQPIIDVFVLAGLFTLRVFAGGLLLPTGISPWLLTFSMLFFLGLAMVKRHAELDRVVRTGGAAVISRGYTARDLPLLLAAGVASSFSSIVIFTIYLINEQYPRDTYNNPRLLWAMMPILLIWVLRVWHLTVQGRMSEDPVVFALKDRTSLFLGVAAALCLFLAWV